MALLDEVGPLASQWGAAIAAFSDPAVRSQPGGFQQYAWNAYQQSYLRIGQTPPALSFQQMNRFISAAASVANGSRTLESAIAQVGRSGLDTGLTSRMLAPDIDARALDTLPLGPNYRVRFQADVTVGGFASTEWFTWEAGLRLPPTVNALLDALDSAGQSFGSRYEMDYEGLGAHVYITTW